jgi:alpha-N-arabinofuranosidase
MQTLRSLLCIQAAGAIDAHKTFDAPETLRPDAHEVELADGKLALELPAKSVTVITVRE